ncbi:MAG: hypothetical protein PVI88_00425 [Nitrosopumilaceae archaeon]|jgi:hypothetical protein
MKKDLIKLKDAMDIVEQYRPRPRRQTMYFWVLKEKIGEFIDGHYFFDRQKLIKMLEEKYGSQKKNS